MTSYPNNVTNQSSAAQTSASIKRTKDTGRRRTVCGTDWPILHQLEGNALRGYSVTEDLCNRDFFRRKRFSERWRAEKYFAALDGVEV